jgi:hypothetical protein
MNHLIESPNGIELVESILSNLTHYELSLLSNRIWKKMTDGDGYQPFGYDSRTMRICHPIDWQAYQMIERKQLEQLEGKK